MRKLLLILALVMGGASLTTILADDQITMSFIKKGSSSSSGTFAPPRPWYITQDDTFLPCLPLRMTLPSNCVMKTM